MMPVKSSSCPMGGCFFCVIFPAGGFIKAVFYGIQGEGIGCGKLCVALKLKARALSPKRHPFTKDTPFLGLCKKNPPQPSGSGGFVLLANSAYFSSWLACSMAARVSSRSCVMVVREAFCTSTICWAVIWGAAA